jgi:hypothetical protein
MKLPAILKKPVAADISKLSKKWKTFIIYSKLDREREKLCDDKHHNIVTCAQQCKLMVLVSVTM